MAEAVGNYLPALLRIAASVAPGTVLRVFVLHDSWCERLAGTGPCNCSPEIVVQPGDALDETS